MKEQIIKILKKYEGIEVAYQFNVASEKEALTNKATPESIADEIMRLVNQEVEKRIVERMPSEEEQDKWADYCAGNTTSDHNKAVLYKAALSLGATWLRSRLSCSEKPNNLKTEGGGE